MANLSVSKSWFAVFNNPQDKGYPQDPRKCCEQLRNEWVTDYPTRSGAWAYCISADGLHHVHMVLEDTKAMRFTAIKASYAHGMHFEATKGSKSQAEAYIKKLPPWDEKGEEVVYLETYGEIRGNQGARNDIYKIEELINDGLTPSQIMEQSFSYRKYEKMIKDAFFAKRVKETPPFREVQVIWHVGESGSGKSYSYVLLTEELGEDNVYLLTDYGTGGFDFYSAQPCLFMDEFKGQMPFAKLLNYLDGYKIQVPARYTNAYALWNVVHITSVYTPDMLYQKMVDGDVRKIDTEKQLLRRIDKIVYHWKHNGEFKKFEIDTKDYLNYEDLKSKAYGDKDGFIPVLDTEQEKLPFI